jgi:hypothetical protein
MKESLTAEEEFVLALLRTPQFFDEKPRERNWVRFRIYQQEFGKSLTTYKRIVQRLRKWKL